MTREEAIQFWSVRSQYLHKWIDENVEEASAFLDYVEAVDMAISALTVIEQTKWERDTALVTLEEHGIGLGQIAEPSDLISRADIVYHKQLEPMGNGQYEEVAVAYADEIDAMPSVSAERVGEWTKEELKQFRDGISHKLLEQRSCQHWRYTEETAERIKWLEALEKKVIAKMEEVR